MDNMILPRDVCRRRHRQSSARGCVVVIRRPNRCRCYMSGVNTQRYGYVLTLSTDTTASYHPAAMVMVGLPRSAVNNNEL